MTLSFRSRLTLRWLLAFGLVLALANLVVYLGTSTFLRRDLDAQLRTLAGTELASAVDEPGMGVHLHEFPVDATRPQDYADKFVQLIDARSRLLMQTPGLGSEGPLLTPVSLEQALSGTTPLVDVAIEGRPGRMIGLRTEGPDRYVIAVGLFTDKLEATLRQLRRLLVGVWLGGLGLTAVVGFALASRALVPIRRITRKAASIAEGEFATRLDAPGVDDEIGQMTRLLNQMLDRLHGAVEVNRRFAADASHELRSPLTAMLGEIDVTLKRARSPEEYRDVLALLRDRLHVMNGMTEDLMLLVRAQERTPPVVCEVPLDSLLAHVADRVASLAAAARVTLSITVTPGLVVYGDRGLLERVFDNVMRNAIHYNHEAGLVTVSAVSRPGSGAWVADQVAITVWNSGVEIPASERERVFERFYRIDPSRSRRTGGAGLGLAISREIVQLFKGTIRVVDTAAGAGTSVEVVLPGGLSSA